MTDIQSKNLDQVLDNAIDPDGYNDLPAITALLDAITAPAILMNKDYEICAANDAYRRRFAQEEAITGRHCYEVSHGYRVPCDQAGETCPLKLCLEGGQRQRILHIHNTSFGREHVDVELNPIRNAEGDICFFVEIMNPVSTPEDPEKRPMVGFSPAYTEMLELLSRAAPSNISVLLLGESGTGKELAAQYLHSHSRRANKAFVTVECSGLTDTLFESELFGHEKGAFTGATHRKPGLVEAARGGTLFLDEVGDIPLDMQVKLLRLIESGTYRPVGSVTPKQADFRLICATHRNLEDQVENGEFRRDLFYRISPFPVYLPSLNARQQDILPLAQQLLKQVSSDKTFKLSETAGNWLKQQNFPGNIRELRNRLERATLLCDTGVIEVEHLTPARPPHFSGQPTTKLRTELNSAKADSNLTSAPETSASTFSLTSTSTFPETTFSEIGVLPLDQLESRYLLDISSAFEGDNAELAKQLGVSERTLYRKLKSARATKL